MGYYIKLEESNFQIKKESDKKILKIWKELNHQKNNYLKRGGSSNGKKWFSWMPENYDKTVKNCKEVLDLLGFETEIKNDNIIITDYDQKTGQEELFLKYASKFIDDHNYLIFRGEEGEYFAYYFYDKQLHIIKSDDFEELKNSFLKFKAIEEKKLIDKELDKLDKNKKEIIKKINFEDLIEKQELIDIKKVFYNMLNNLNKLEYANPLLFEKYNDNIINIKNNILQEYSLNNKINNNIYIDLINRLNKNILLNIQDIEEEINIKNKILKKQFN